MQPSRSALSSLKLPSEKVVLSFLKQDKSTRSLDSQMLEAIARVLADQCFDQYSTLKLINLKIDWIQFNDLNSALYRCAGGKELPRPNISEYETKAKLLKEKKDTVIQLAEKDNFDGCLKIVDAAADWQDKNEICEAIASYYAKKGSFGKVQAALFKMESNHGCLSIERCQNDAYAKVAAIFAEHGYLKEAFKSIDSIRGDYSKYDDSEFSTGVRERVWKIIIEILIKQQKYSEADKLLWNVGKDDRYFLEKRIKKALGTWAEPNSVSPQRYWSSSHKKELTIEELTVENIKIYAKNRADKELDLSDRPPDRDINSDRISQWRKKKIEEKERMIQDFIKSFEFCTTEEQCRLLKKYVQNPSQSYFDNEEINDVISYLSNP